MYGQVPTINKSHFRVLESAGSAFQGRASRRQVRLFFQGQNGPSADLLIYRPIKNQKPPTLLALNFWGNHSVVADPAIELSQSWMESGKNIFIDLSCVQNHRAKESMRL
jgi:hypothetical protein